MEYNSPVSTFSEEKKSLRWALLYFESTSNFNQSLWSETSAPRKYNRQLHVFV